MNFSQACSLNLVCFQIDGVIRLNFYLILNIVRLALAVWFRRVNKGYNVCGRMFSALRLMSQLGQNMTTSVCVGRKTNEREGTAGVGCLDLLGGG